MVNDNLAKKNYINNLLNTYFNLFVVIFVSFLLLISYFLLLKPKVTETTNSISENISSHERLLQAEKTKLANLQEAVRAYQNINKDDLTRVNSILPDEYNKEALYGEIEEIIKQNGFIPTSIALAKEGETKEGGASNNTPSAAASSSSHIGAINISLSIASIDYAGMKNLLNILQNNLRLLDVKNLKVSDGGAATLEMTTYYYKK